MTRQDRTPAAKIEEAVRAAGASRVDPRDTSHGGAVVLDRHVAAGAAGDNLTGRELAGRARRVFDEAKRLRKVATRRLGPRAARASERADEALRTAAVQIRLAQATPLDRGYLHALDLERIQTIKAEVSRAFDADAAALAVDTHRRIRDQRLRVDAEGRADR